MNREQFLKDVIEVGHRDGIYFVSKQTLVKRGNGDILCCPIGAAYYKETGWSILEDDEDKAELVCVFEKIRAKYNLTKQYTDGIINTVDGYNAETLYSHSEHFQQAVKDVNMLRNIFTFNPPIENV